MMQIIGMIQNTAFDTINGKETFFANPVIVDIIS